MTQPITRLLIANRGEIVRRIIRSAHGMGIGTVAVYADGDAQAPFVLEADQAIALDGVSSAETYLTTVDGIRFREIAVEASSDSLQADRPLWYALALCAFGVLLCEWWFFQRRPGGWQ